MLTSRRNFLKWATAAAAVCAVGVRVVRDYVTCDACDGPLGVKILAACVVSRGQAYCAECAGGITITNWHFKNAPVDGSIVTVYPDRGVATNKSRLTDG